MPFQRPKSGGKKLLFSKCGVKWKCGVKMWRQAQMWWCLRNHGNVAWNNVASQCGVRHYCGGAFEMMEMWQQTMWRQTLMWRQSEMWRQTMWRQNVAPNTPCAKRSSRKCLFKKGIQWQAQKCYAKCLHPEIMDTNIPMQTEGSAWSAPPRFPWMEFEYVSVLSTHHHHHHHHQQHHHHHHHHHHYHHYHHHHHHHHHHHEKEWIQDLNIINSWVNSLSLGIL